MDGKVYSLGHSNLALEAFVRHLERQSIQAVLDVRTVPFSRRFPWFNQPKLDLVLNLHGISYVYLGRELGGRPEKDSFYTDGIANYQKMAQSPDFEWGIQRVLELSAQAPCALLCSEGDPLLCHRLLLVSRALKRKGIEVEHILPTGELRSQGEMESELLRMHHLEPTLLETESENLSTAYMLQNTKVAYRKHGHLHEGGA